MPGKRKETSGAAGQRASGRSKRPARTIDLEAEEVDIEVKDAAAEEKPAPEEASGDAKAAPDATAAPEEPHEDLPPPKPQRTGPSEIKAFVTHLAAGLVGGLVGVVGAGIGLDRLPLPWSSGESAAPAMTAQIEERLDELSSKLQDQSKALTAAVQKDNLEQLTERLAAVETRPPPEASLPDGMTARVARLEDTLKTLQGAAGDAGATGLEQSAALSARIDAVSADMEKRGEALKSQIETLESALASEASARKAVDGPQARALDARISALEEKIAALADQPVSAIPRAQGNAAALTLAFESLRRAAGRGEPYKTQLDALGKLAGNRFDLAGLAVKADAGVPTASALLARLPEVLAQARDAAARSDDETFLDRLASNARSVVRVRRVGPVEGESTEAVLSRMEARMKASDLDGILGEAKGLQGAARDAVQTWLGEATAHSELQAALDALESQLLARFEKDAGGQAQR